MSLLKRRQLTLWSFCSKRGRKKVKMAKSNDNLSRLLTGSSKLDGQSVSKLLAITNLVTGSTAGTTSNSSRAFAPGTQSGLKGSSLTASSSLTGIRFGNAPGSALTSSATGGQWANLLKQAASGSGVASAFSGGLSGLGGIGSIVSGIMGLFGGNKNSLPALTAFHLPDSQEHSASVRAASYSVNTGQISSSATADGANGSPGTAQSASSNFDSQWFLDNSNNIAQAVKNAMLNSNSLNDVVSEV